MQTLHESELSYTQDHKLDLNGIARTLLEDVANTVMVEQVEELGCVRNGYRERKLVTCKYRFNNCLINCYIKNL